MCGIVGLLVRNPKMRDSIGELMLPMLIGMTERGPDSAGLAMFGAPVAADARKFSLYSGVADFNWVKLGHDFEKHLSIKAKIEPKANHAVMTTTLEPATVKIWLKEHYPQLHLLSVGQLMDIYKDVGTPAQVADRYDFKNFKGTHLVGHTRMATESAITPAHAHPFTAG
ncbi:MAG: amidophosphoribosyltransferase, partial [Methylotenera sp.]